MNFFEHQEKARKQSRWIILAFLAVAILIIIAVDIIVLLLFSLKAPLSSGVAHITHGGLGAITNPDFLAANMSTLLGSSAATGGVIGLASLGKIASLRSGGGKVARSMGATLVTPNTRDPLRRRLYNVVEEIALASGAPVPEVYVMENEPGINAFAAGYATADAAVAVTSGTLEKLDRSELQGVIAHEFSHILNGDMRINIRMMGIIFGIMVIAILGRQFLHSNRFRLSSSREKGGSAIIFIGAALMMVGYIGLFFARWMKSALSRQREFLADASAVQFTRDPSGISGALKKIAAYNHSSYLKSDAEEVSHMLFGSGYRTFMFATHPPLEHRIERIEKRFDANEIAQIAENLRAQEIREHVQADKAEKEQQAKAEGKARGGIFDVDSLINNIGNPEFERIAAAALMTANLRSALSTAARSLEWAPEVLFYCLLDDDEALRQKQLLMVIQEMGDISEAKLNHLIQANGMVKVEERLPLLEICFPTLKRRPNADIEKILKTIEHLALADKKIDPFEYLLSRLVTKYLYESHAPNRTRLHGKKHLKDCIEELTLVVSAVAAHGQNSQTSQGLQHAQKAFREGMASAGINHKNLSFSDDWHTNMDNALKTLDKLRPADKKMVVVALARTALSDGEVVTNEHEMVRVICSLIHVPIPLLQAVDA